MEDLGESADVDNDRSVLPLVDEPFTYEEFFRSGTQPHGRWQRPVPIRVVALRLRRSRRDAASLDRRFDVHREAGAARPPTQAA